MTTPGKLFGSTGAEVYAKIAQLGAYDYTSNVSKGSFATNLQIYQAPNVVEIPTPTWTDSVISAVAPMTVIENENWGASINNTAGLPPQALYDQVKAAGTSWFEAPPMSQQQSLYQAELAVSVPTNRFAPPSAQSYSAYQAEVAAASTFSRPSWYN